MNKNKNVFVLTMEHNEDYFLPIFLRHYSQFFEPKNIFVIDHGSNSNLIPQEFNRIYLPRDKPFSETVRLNFIKDIAHGLLRYYDAGIYVDCDELIYLNDFNFDVLKTSSPIYLAGFECTVAQVSGEKKLIGILNPHEFKPLIFKGVPDWIGGFHSAKNAEPSDFLSIPMVHLKFFSQKQFELRGESRKNTYKEMVADERDMGIDHHWADSDGDSLDFYNKINDEIKKNSPINKFSPILSGAHFKKLEPHKTLYVQSEFIYIPQGTSREQHGLVDLSNLFPDLLNTPEG